jgi:hypothetical protein
VIANNPINPSPSSQFKAIVSENLAFPPEKPDAFTVNQDETNKSQIALKITEPTNNGGSTIETYYLWWRNPGEQDFKLLKDDIENTQPTVQTIITQAPIGQNIQPGQSLEFQVEAINKRGPGARSDTLVAKAAGFPSAPTV